VVVGFLIKLRNYYIGSYLADKLCFTRTPQYGVTDDFLERLLNFKYFLLDI